MEFVDSIEAPKTIPCGFSSDGAIVLQLITAEEDKRTPPKYGDFLEKHIQKASRVHIQNAGHIAPMEKPDEVNKAMREFLNNVGPLKSAI